MRSRFGIGGLSLCVVLASIAGTASGQIFQRADGIAQAFDEGFGIDVTRDGGYIAAGATRDLVQNKDVLVIRHDRAGNPMWSMRYELTSPEDSAWDVIELENGDFAVGGWVSNPSTGQPPQPWHLFIMRLDPAGNLRWAYRYQGLPFGGSTLFDPFRGINLEESVESLDQEFPNGRDILMTGTSENNRPMVIRVRPDGRLLVASEYFFTDPATGEPIQVAFTDLKEADAGVIFVSGTVNGLLQNTSAADVLVMQVDSNLFTVANLSAFTSFDPNDGSLLGETGDALQLDVDNQRMFIGGRIDPRLRTDDPVGPNPARQQVGPGIGPHVLEVDFGLNPLRWDAYPVDPDVGGEWIIDYGAIDVNRSNGDIAIAGTYHRASPTGLFDPRAAMIVTESGGDVRASQIYGEEFVTVGHDLVWTGDLEDDSRCGYALIGAIDLEGEPNPDQPGLPIDPQFYLVKTNDDAVSGCLERELPVRREPLQFEPLDVRVQTNALDGDERLNVDPIDIKLVSREFCFSDECAPGQPCPADVNGDGMVTIADVLFVIARFGDAGINVPGDANGDGVVTIADVLFITARFGPCP